MAPQDYQPNVAPVHRPNGPYAISVKDAADMVGLDATTVRSAIDKQQLPAKKVGRVLRIRVSDVEAWFDGLDDARESA